MNSAAALADTPAVETFTRNPTTATAQIDGQLVALDVQAGICFGLNEVATQIWQMLDQHSDVPSICDALLCLYDIDRETCEAQTLALLHELADIGLIARG